MSITSFGTLRRHALRLLVVAQLALAGAGCAEESTQAEHAGAPADGDEAATPTREASAVEKGGATQSCESFWLADGFALVGRCKRADDRTLNDSGVWLPDGIGNRDGWLTFNSAGFNETCWGCSVGWRFGELQLVCSCLRADQSVNEAVLGLDSHITNNDGFLSIDHDW